MQKELVAKNDLIKCLMETQTTVLEFVFSVWKNATESGKLHQKQVVSLNKSIFIFLETHSNRSRHKQCTSAPNNISNKPKISWATAKTFNNRLSDLKRRKFYIAKKICQMWTKKLERISKFWNRINSSLFTTLINLLRKMSFSFSEEIPISVKISQ